MISVKALKSIIIELTFALSISSLAWAGESLDQDIDSMLYIKGEPDHGTDRANTYNYHSNAGPDIDQNLILHSLQSNPGISFLTRDSKIKMQKPDAVRLLMKIREKQSLFGVRCQPYSTLLRFSYFPVGSPIRKTIEVNFDEYHEPYLYIVGSNKLGEGTFGIVQKVVHTSDWKWSAMKSGVTFDLCGRRNTAVSLKPEKDILQKIATLPENKQIGLLTCGSLLNDHSQDSRLYLPIYDSNLKFKLLKPEHRWKVSYDIISGLKSLHSLKIVHNDLAPANILFSQKNGNINAVISDFGEATDLERMDHFSSNLCHLGYEAPEVHSAAQMSINSASIEQIMKRDVYSLAKIIQMVFLRFQLKKLSTSNMNKFDPLKFILLNLTDSMPDRRMSAKALYHFWPFVEKMVKSDFNDIDIQDAGVRALAYSVFSHKEAIEKLGSMKKGYLIRSQSILNMETTILYCKFEEKIYRFDLGESHKKMDRVLKKVEYILKTLFPELLNPTLDS
ncbi:MAG: protein kinase [Bdellovibrionia bacterium]